ncbi:MAG: LysM peptidoglycan-binding domain-containing protein [Spirochaetaceae bacterium]|jgi:nucleoid-associated protein YgaU|nr:LysM peptidoglycan-binding domain-containing protein [Spirochaetaceae bacterium]
MKRFMCLQMALLSLAALYPEDGDAVEEQPVSYALQNNDYYKESVRQRNLARLNFEAGEYDASSEHSAEAERYAKLSDEYIAKRLLEARLGKAIQAAADHIAWAKANEAATYFPVLLTNAENHYAAALELRKAGELHGALENALAVEKDLSGVAAPPKMTPAGKVEEPPDMPLKPNQYTVRPWDVFGDCFWNIAERFYGDPRRWPVLYNANKDKLPDINNPNLIETGTVIDIPNIGEEAREGKYDTGKPYTNESIPSKAR